MIPRVDFLLDFGIVSQVGQELLVDLRFVDVLLDLVLIMVPVVHGQCPLGQVGLDSNFGEQVAAAAPVAAVGDLLLDPLALMRL